MTVSGDWQGPVEVAVIIKAAPETGQKHGETVCVAGIDRFGKWHRLYPMPFRDLLPEQRFNRWDIIRVNWRRPMDDDRLESKRVDHRSLVCIGPVPRKERHEFANRAIVNSLEDEKASGRSLALIRPENVRFGYRRISENDLQKVRVKRRELVAQTDLFAGTVLTEEPPPVAFYYQFDHAEKRRTHICIDWETERTFFKWRDMYGEAETLKMMCEKWGDEWPRRGIAFAMGTHRVKVFNNWLLSGVIRVNRMAQGSLPL